jgi:outer membrane protein assembly factor BamA
MGLQGQLLRDELSSVAQAERLGGFSNLRGFNEQSIFANSWLMSTIELRYLMTERTHASVFWNGAQTQLRTAEASSTNRRFQGFGLSAGFETRPGILQITWAMGQEQGRALSWRDAKIHAGLVSLF